MVQVPALINVSAPPLVIVQTPVVEDVNDTANDEVEVAVKVGVVPKFCEPGLENVMVCGCELTPVITRLLPQSETATKRPLP